MKNTRWLIYLMLVIVSFAALTLTGCDLLTGGGEHEHEFIEQEGKLPTCTEGGFTSSYVCTGCDEVIESTVLDALGHDFSDGYTDEGAAHSRTCKRCSKLEEEPHNWLRDRTIKTATCTEEGQILYICKICEAEKLESTEPKGHTFLDNYFSDESVHTRSCIYCFAPESEEHTWQQTSYVAPTCEEDGVRSYICDICDREKTEVINALGHDISLEYVPNGDVHSRLCSRCDMSIDNEHSWQETESVSPTCIAEGYTKYICTVCEAEKNDIAPPTGEHFDGEWEITLYPTATTDGLKVLHCVNCPAIIAEVVLDADTKEMPIVYLTGDYTAATNKKNEVEMQVSYYDPTGENSFDAYATIKVQGATSTAYPKKNYTIKFYKDETFDKKLKIDLGWGKESKYVMKANWVDFIQARNVVSCRLWGDMVKSRNISVTQQRLAALPTNGGAIDGYPIAVYMNGVFHGIYTMNVPKDEWMFGMDDCETEALLGADDWNHTNFSSTIGYFKEDSAGDLVTDGWELKYCGTDDTTWVTDSFNELILFCQQNEGDAFRAGASKHLDVDAAIDYLILMYVNFMRDNSSKNMLWVTFDGKVWVPSVYDQDGVFGQAWDGKRYAEANKMLPGVSNGKITHGVDFGPDNQHLYNGEYFILWDRIWNAYTEEVLVRYKELRETVLSEENIIAEFETFRACIPESVYQADVDRWDADRASWWKGYESSGLWYEKFGYDYTYNWISDRLDYLDEAMRTIYNNAYLPSTNNPAI